MGDAGRADVPARGAARDRDRLAAGPAALRFGFETCGFEKLLSIRHLENEASRRVMEKLGLHYDFETTVPANGQPVAVHSISRAEYSGPRG